MTTSVSERIAIVAPSAEAVATLRGDLIASLSARGHRVLCISPPGPARYLRTLRANGAQHRALEPSQPSIRLLADWQKMSALVAQFKDWQPDIVLGFGLHTLTLAALAARRANVRRVVSLVNALPSDGIESVNRSRFAQAIRASDAIVFHNRENERTLKQLGLLPANLMTMVVPGSGVDLDRFPAVPMPPIEDGLEFLMLSRLERRRGVMEFIAAADRLKQKWPDTSFRLAGPASTEPDAVLPEKVTASGSVAYLGPLEDVRADLAACHVFVYPSYVEGMPRAIQEALATGRPVITTRTPGCADTVDEKVSGCLIPPADVDALVVAMESYLKNPGSLVTGARAARLKAERRFDVRDVNAALARALGVD